MKKTEKTLLETYEASLPPCPLPYSEVEKKVDFQLYASPQRKKRRMLWILPVSLVGMSAVALSIILPLALRQTPSLSEKDKIVLALDGVEKTLQASKGAGDTKTSSAHRKASFSENSLSIIKSYLVADENEEDPELSPDDYPFAQLFFARNILKALSSFESGQCFGEEKTGAIGFDFTTYEPSTAVSNPYTLTTKVSFSLTEKNVVEVGGAFLSEYQNGAISQLFPFQASIAYDFSGSDEAFTLTLLSGDIREGFPSDHQESTYEYAYLSSASSLVREYRHFSLVSKTPLLLDSAHPSFQDYLKEGVSYVDEAEVYDGARYAKSRRTGIADESGQKGITEIKQGIGIPIVDDFGCNQNDLQAAKWKQKAYAKEEGVASAVASLEEQLGESLALQLLDENGRDYNFEEEKDVLQSVSLGDRLSLDDQNRPNAISDFVLSSDVSFESLFKTSFPNGEKESLLCFTSFWESLPGLARILPLDEFAIYVADASGGEEAVDISSAFSEIAKAAFPAEASQPHSLTFFYDYPPDSSFNIEQHTFTARLDF